MAQGDGHAGTGEGGLMEWYQVKLFVAHLTTLSMDALHIVGGFAGLLLVARLFRRPVTDGRPWLAVLALELLNEWSDLTVERWPEMAIQLGEGAKDVLLTMLVPTILLLVARRRPLLLAPAKPMDGDAA